MNCIKLYNYYCIYNIYFLNCSTTENVSIFIWDKLKYALGAKSDLLYEVCVHETENNVFIYRGE